MQPDPIRRLLRAHGSLERFVQEADVSLASSAAKSATRTSAYVRMAQRLAIAARTVESIVSSAPTLRLSDPRPTHLRAQRRLPRQSSHLERCADPVPPLLVITLMRHSRHRHRLLRQPRRLLRRAQSQRQVLIRLHWIRIKPGTLQPTFRCNSLLSIKLKVSPLSRVFRTLPLSLRG